MSFSIQITFKGISQEQQENNRWIKLIRLSMGLKIGEYVQKTIELLTTPDMRTKELASLSLVAKSMQFLSRSSALEQYSHQRSSLLGDAGQIIALAELTFIRAGIARDMARLRQLDTVN